MNHQSQHDPPRSIAPADREAEVVATMVKLADSLVDDHDQIDALSDLVATCARVLDADAAGISLGRDDKGLDFLVASDESMETIELFQSEQDEGPCIDAYRSGAHVWTTDLIEDRERWPTWSRRAHDLGFRAADAFPLRLRASRLGAMNVYARRERQLADDDVALGKGFADMATIAILQKRSADDLAEVRDQLQHALDSRVVIEQAKGVLAERLQLSPQEAFERLRSHSRAHGTKLHEVARRVVEGDLQLLRDAPG